MRSDQEKITRLLKTARGQLDGLLRMVEEDRYCVDISNQILATQAILRTVNQQILQDHINTCVREAMRSDDADEKIGEIMSIIEKLAK
ncbi:MAG: metal-sensing transcriptional repressor [Limnochordia bacterium]|jgi:DNA-binding FrmR family transcriptional regulator|nr:metal-sensing transcriptional repressor [Bacillota bacterium]NLL08864.1 metal-sensing transcriptional repressor [Bacillota bacterium]HBG09715.1 transcriptional regulator [Bacillota bacterium]